MPKPSAQSMPESSTSEPSTSRKLNIEDRLGDNFSKPKNPLRTSTLKIYGREFTTMAIRDIYGKITEFINIKVISSNRTDKWKLHTTETRNIIDKYLQEQDEEMARCELLVSQENITSGASCDPLLKDKSAVDEIFGKQITWIANRSSERTKDCRIYIYDKYFTVRDAKVGDKMARFIYIDHLHGIAVKEWKTFNEEVKNKLEELLQQESESLKQVASCVVHAKSEESHSSSVTSFKTI